MAQYINFKKIRREKVQTAIENNTEFIRNWMRCTRRGNYVYDRTANEYLKPTRKLSLAEWLLVANVKKDGYDYKQIFNQIGAL